MERSPTLDYAGRRVRVTLNVAPCCCHKCKCPKAVQKLWAKLAGVEKIEVDSKYGFVTIDGSLDNDLIDRAINKMKLLCMRVNSYELVHLPPPQSTRSYAADDTRTDYSNSGSPANQAADSMSSMRISDDTRTSNTNRSSGRRGSSRPPLPPVVFREPREGGYFRSDSSSSSGSGYGYRPPRVPGVEGSRANRAYDSNSSSGSGGCSGYETPQSWFSGEGYGTPQSQFSNHNSSSSSDGNGNNGEVQNVDFGEFIFGGSNYDSDDYRQYVLNSSSSGRERSASSEPLPDPNAGPVEAEVWDNQWFW